MNTRAPQRFVRIDVANARDRPLRKQLRLHSSRARLRCLPQLLCGERVIKRFGPLRREGRQCCVLPRRDHRDAAEATHVAILEGRAIIEHPPCPDIGVEFVRRRDPQHARHAKVHDEFAGVVESEQQVFAASADVVDARPGGRDRRRELRRWMGVGIGDASPGQTWCELASDRFDLG